MNAPNTEQQALIRYLEGRWSEEQVRQRLSREGRSGEPVFDGRSLQFHPENWSLMRFALRWGLRVTGLYERGTRNALRLRVRRHHLRLPGLPAPLAGVRLLHMSDLHLDMHPDFPGLLRKRVQPLNYDVCLITGDFRYSTTGSYLPAIDALKHVLEVVDVPVYAVLGNHDPLAIVPALERIGVRVLLNEAVLWEERGQPLALAGVDDPHYFGCHDLERARDGVPEGVPLLLLSHSPELYREAAEAGYLAYFCGHTHGGQISLPGGIPVLTNARCPRSYCQGSWSYGGMQGYTTVGAGSSVLDVRFNCQPEVVLHILSAAQRGDVNTSVFP
ncbi:MAG: metallophosphoesterase family protein [Ectothiorhodospiraceae bacterium]|nr:metallophosphoesterase family protein [Ectothiorhodospiraceae bacterium]MCH8505178.1 metallophosphoesterase [Ectothiorhodospiraceae bacterium]